MGQRAMEARARLQEMGGGALGARCGWTTPGMRRMRGEAIGGEQRRGEEGAGLLPGALRGEREEGEMHSREGEGIDSWRRWRDRREARGGVWSG